MPQWTNEQQAILDAKGNIIVSAAAGSGKTTVMTQRIANDVKSGISIANIFVSTFMSAAANDMKAKIENKLLNAAYETEDAEGRKYLLSQARQVKSANISTLHSFCTYLMHRHFYDKDVDLSPDFRTIDEVEKSTLLSEALQEATERILVVPDNEKVIAFFGGKDQFMNNIKTIYGYMCNMPNGKEWLKKAVANYALSDIENTPLMKAYCDSAMSYIELAINATQAQFSECPSCRNEDKAREKTNEQLELLESIKNAATYSEKYELLNAGYVSYSGARGLSAEFKLHKDLAKKCYEKAQKLFYTTTEDMERIIHFSYPYIRRIAGATLLAMKIYDDKKRKLNVIDFSDMEKYALILLSKPEIAKIYQEKFKYIYVDEYQDISRIQDAILDRLSVTENRFYVGDIKQSIYRFRNSDPTLFMEKSKDSAFLCMPLDANFRSSDSVVDFVNETFRVIMSEKTGGVKYDDKCSLKKRSRYKNGMAKLIYIEKDIKSTLSDAEINAACIAEQIKDLMQNGTFTDAAENSEGDATPRKYRYSDFAIIMRNTYNEADIMATRLSQEGIPVFVVAEGEFFNEVEISVFMNLLRVMDNRRQDIPLISVLHSHIGGFSAEELLEMKDAANHELTEKPGMWDTLCYAAEKETKIGKKAKTFIEKAEKWHKCSTYMELVDYIRMLFEETNITAYVRALPGGDIRYSNLEHFVAIANTFDKNIGGGLYRFLTYLDDMQKYNSSVESTQSPIGNAVSIMTMHKSKGLEYNVVIIPRLEREMNRTNNKRADACIRMNTDGFMGFDTLLPYKIYKNADESYTLSVKHKSFYFTALDRQKKKEELEDELRLLYVALTRAHDRLILISCGDSIKDDYQEAVNISDTDNYVLTAKNRIQWLLYSVINSRHKGVIEKVVTEGMTPVTETNDAAFTDETSACDTENVVKTYIHYPISASDDMFELEVFALSHFEKRETVYDKEAYDKKIEEVKSTSFAEADEYLHRRYHHEKSVYMPSKGSVTGFSHANYKPSVHEIADSDRVPKNESDVVRKNTDEVSATDRGTATHLVFELMPLVPHTKKEVKAFIKDITEKGYMTQAVAKSLNTDGIAAYFERDLYKRVISSEIVEREKEFACLVPANMVNPEFPDDEEVLLQGIIDMYFMEKGKWVVVDYKTDRVDANNEAACIAQANTHRMQLELYSYVLKTITGIDVSECYIVLVNAGDVRVI